MSQDDEKSITRSSPHGSEDVAGCASDNAEARVAYTAFTPFQRRLISWVLGFITLASPLTATIYFPLLPLLQSHFNVSAQAINLTLTLYVLFQALSPLILASPSDTVGRRPILLGTFALYTIASLGLALNRTSYAALLVFRALQSIGASAVLAVAYGAVADVCVPSERGSMLGVVMAASNLGPCIGPIVGGAVAYRSGGYEWAFWFLMLFGAAGFLVIGALLPETARAIVGNGERPPKRWVFLTWWQLLRSACASRVDRDPENEAVVAEQESSSTLSISVREHLLRPLRCLRVVLHRDTALAIWMSASFYALWYCIQARIPAIFAARGWTELLIGCAFLPGGAGVVVGGLATGRLMDFNYSRTAREVGLEVDRLAGDDIRYFPIERARARSATGILLVFAAALIGYGWTIEIRASPAVPLVLQFILAIICTYFFQTFNTLLVDIFPDDSGMAAAAGNVSRCILSAVTVAVLHPLIVAMGYGWFFTGFGILLGIGNVGVAWVIVKYGQAWREARLRKVEERKQESPAQGRAEDGTGEKKGGKSNEQT